MSIEPAVNGEATAIFQELAEYPWSTDSQYQSGLTAILGNTTDPSQITNLTLRAQCFYYARKKQTPIDFDAYKAYLDTKSSPPTTTSIQEEPLPEHPHPIHLDPTTLPPLTSTTPSQNTAPYPPTFAEIISLIQSGADIPGCIDIPPVVLTSQATKPSAPKRLKPWETSLQIPLSHVQGAGAPLPSSDPDEPPTIIEGTFGDQRDRHIVQEFPDDA